MMPEKRVGETNRELVTRLADLKWLQDCTSQEEVRDAIVKEQLLDSLCVSAWVRE